MAVLRTRTPPRSPLSLRLLMLTPQNASTIDAIPSLTEFDCSYAHFRQHHLLPNEPCLISPSLVDDWQIKRRVTRADGALDWDYLKENFGLYAAVCVDCEGRSECGDGDEVEVRTFGDLLELWEQGRGRTKYLKDWHLPLLVYHEVERLEKGKGKERVREELYEVPQLWLDDWMNEWEGSEGDDDFRFVVRARFRSRSAEEELTDLLAVRWRRRYFHALAPRRLCVRSSTNLANVLTPTLADCSYSISTQLYGRKRWYLFPPSCTPYLRPLVAKAERNDTSVNCDEWNEERKKEFRGRGMLVVEQKEGESIFMCVRSPPLVEVCLTNSALQSIRLLPLCPQPDPPDPLAQPQLAQLAQPSRRVPLAVGRGRAMPSCDRGCEGDVD